jgi:hypothetical protein
MFKLIAALFIVTNGAPAEHPAHIMTYNHATFETEESCKDYLETDMGRAAITAIGLSAISRGIAVKFSCVQAEDNTI